MKHPKKITAIVIVLFVIVIYVFIPNEIVITQGMVIPQPAAGITRSLTKIEDWGKWMPAKSVKGQHFVLANGTFDLSASFLSTTKSNFNIHEMTAPVTFAAIATGKDSSILKYECIVDNRHVSPIQRLQDYWTALQIKSQMNQVLEAAAKHYAYTKHIYKFDIVEDHVKDSILVSTHKNLTDTPTITQLYDMIHVLEAHIQKNNGIIHGAPMVNITKIGDKDVFAQVAIPLAHSIPATNEIQIKKMVLGNILTVKVQGDNLSVAQAFAETENYLHDRLKSSPAIPFVVYNTNRIVEKNPQKWISTIYYPVY